MILLSYVILGHPDWKKAEIKIFALLSQKEIQEQKAELFELIKAGRLPISVHNIRLIEKSEHMETKEVIRQESKDADLTIVGFRGEGNFTGVFAKRGSLTGVLATLRTAMSAGFVM